MSEDNLIYDIDGARLPYSISAEQAVLGSMIIDPNCIDEVAVCVKADYFYLKQHKQIFEAISSMSSSVMFSG